MARLLVTLFSGRELFGKSVALAKRIALAKQAMTLGRCNAFDPGWYIHGAALSPLTTPETALLHWLLVGVHNRIDPHPLFNVRWYLRRCPELRDSGENPLLSYLGREWREDRSPSPLFDWDYYLASYPDARETGTNPWVQFAQRGPKEDRMPNELLDPKWYRHEYKLRSSIDALKHYLLAGADLGFRPSPRFDSSWYLINYPDVAEAGVNPLRHFLELGKEEGRLPLPPDGETLSNFVVSDVPSSRIRALQLRFLHQGYFEGEITRDPKKPAVLLCAHAANTELFGAERSFLEILQVIRELPYQAYVLVPNEDRTYIDALKPHALGIVCIPYQFWHRDRQADLSAIASMVAFMVEKGISLVHVNTIVVREPLLAARRLGLPSLTHVRESVGQDRWMSDMLGLGGRVLVRDVVKSTDFIIANSEQTAREFHKAERTFVVPNTFDMEALDLTNDVTGEHLNVGLLSSNLPKKGIEDFAQLATACALSYPCLRFRLIGPQNEHIRDLQRRQEAGELAQNLEFVNYQKAPTDALLSVNVVVSFSHFAESFGRTVVEAQAARRPVIVYDLGVPKTLVAEGVSGYVLPVGQWKDAIPLLAALERDRDRVTEMGEAGRESVQSRFSRSCGTEALRRTYDAALSSHPALPADQTGVKDDVESALGGAENYRSEEILSTVSTSSAIPTVCVPVYNAYEDVCECLKSLVRCKGAAPHEVLLLDDCSTDERIWPLLQAYAARHVHLKAVRNDKNLGYTATVNRLCKSGSGDVILLNSDTIVTPRWIEKLSACAYSRTKVATVTAISNAAGAFSVPCNNQVNVIPREIGVDGMAKLIEYCTERRRPEVPTGNGFCLYVTRTALNEVGYFDEKRFPRGYGEENDFCLRASALGFVHLVDDTTYIGHKRSASFGAEKQRIIAESQKTLEALYPHYKRAVEDWLENDPLNTLRHSIAAVLEESQKAEAEQVQ